MKIKPVMIGVLLSTFAFQSCNSGSNEPLTAVMLEKELLAHGKLFRYHYTDSGSLRLMESKDINDQHIYASIRVEPQLSALDCITSTEKKATYHYESREKAFKIKDGHKKLETQQLLPPLLTKVSSPFFRHEELEYSPKHLLEMMLGKETLFQCTYKSVHGYIPKKIQKFA